MEPADRRDLDALGAHWAASGAMALTGRADGPPLGAPAGLVSTVVELGRRFTLLAAERGHAVSIDALALLGERAAIAGLHRQGDISCGGATRLLPSGDGSWMALTIARDSDAELIPAWLDDASPVATDWDRVAELVAGRDVDELVGRAALIGLACARVGEVSAAVADPLVVSPRPPCPARRAPERPVVVDLSSLWAGPLCAHLLGLAGARVVKVESTHRPDGARRGPAAFFDLLHAGHQHVALDLTSAGGRRRLRCVLERADVVITASRPRALQQLGCPPESIIGPRVWLDITAHGPTGDDGAGRVGFGDDIAAAGGLVVRDERGPCFIADAVADPLAGLAGAVGVLDALERAGSWHIDLAMARLAAAAATGPVVGTGHTASPPRARSTSGSAPALGAHTAGVLHELGCR